MPQVLVRNVDPGVLARLQQRARRPDRSLEAELRVIFGEAVAAPDARVNVEAETERVRGLFAGRVFSDSTELLREDRER